MHTSQRGATLLELAISAALIVMIAAAVGQSITDGAADMASTSRTAELFTDGRRVLHEMSRELADSGHAPDGSEQVLSHPRADLTDADWVMFRKRVGFAGDATDWSAPITYSLAASPGEIPDNAIDDDGDGLTDERLLVRDEDGDVARLADDVAALRVIRDPGTDLLRLRLQVVRPGHRNATPLTATLDAQVSFRNRYRE